MILGGFLLISLIAYGAQEQCTVGKLQGRYVFTGQGTNPALWRVRFRRHWQIFGQADLPPYKTSVQRENLSGTYTLEADCTGTMTLEGQLGGTAHWDVLVTQDGKKGRMIRTDSGARGVRTFEQ
jgi:hypothetical protein